MQRSPAHSPRMEPPDMGSPSPWESSQLFSILLGTCQGSGLKWQGTGSGEDRQPSWLWGRFLLPEPVRGLPPHRWEHGGRVTPTPGLVSTQQDTTRSLRPPRPGALSGECECTRVPRAGAGWVCTVPQAPWLPEFWTWEGAMRRQPGPVRQGGAV